MVDKARRAGYPSALSHKGPAMSSKTAQTKRKRARRRKNAGHARKLKQGRHSTISAKELFAALGEPGKPAPAPAPTSAAQAKA